VRASIRTTRMSSRLRRYLLGAYGGAREIMPEKVRKDFPIQIDDQDDNDNLSEFCTIFVLVRKNSCFEIELSGKIPISREISDFAEIYGGYGNQQTGKIVMNLTPYQIEALIDLAKMIRATAASGNAVGNANWHRLSARTISSLYRFVRIIKEYMRSRRLHL
jgi:hypothetical protein